MTTSARLALICSLASSVAHGAELPRIAFLSMGFREATVTDFAASAQAPARRADRSGFLRGTADFNGDGSDDEARILINEQRSIAYVVAVIQSAAKVDTYVLSQMALEDVRNVGIAAAKPLPDDRSRGFAGVTIFALDTKQGDSSYFDGEDFNTRVPLSNGTANPVQGNVRNPP